jgi:hypothetical protein
MSPASGERSGPGHDVGAALLLRIAEAGALAA